MVQESRVQFAGLEKKLEESNELNKKQKIRIRGLSKQYDDMCITKEREI
jgi:hypothetical protein